MQIDVDTGDVENDVHDGAWVDHHVGGAGQLRVNVYDTDGGVESWITYAPGRWQEAMLAKPPTPEEIAARVQVDKRDSKRIRPDQMPGAFSDAAHRYKPL